MRRWRPGQLEGGTETEKMRGNQIMCVQPEELTKFGYSIIGRLNTFKERMKSCLTRQNSW